MSRENLRLFRMKQGLLSKEMADKLGVTAAYYSRIEKGRVNPSWEFGEKFYEVFKDQYDDFWELFKKEK